MALHDKIVKAVNRARTAWAAMMGGAIILVAVTTPTFWSFALLIPFGIISYMILLATMAWLLSGNVTEEDLREAEAKQDSLDVRMQDHVSIPEVEKVLAESGMEMAVVKKLGPIVGAYRDKPIYEYINVKAVNAKRAEKFLYHGPANVINGVPEIPEIDGMVFAVVEGILYSKGQPANE